METRVTHLNLNSLQTGWQRERIKAIASNLWPREDVLAMWVVGSLARDEADEYSDADLWIAVADASFDEWEEMDMATVFAESLVASRKFRISEDAVLHSSLISGGRYFDLGIQKCVAKFDGGRRLVLGSKDPGFLAKLTEQDEEIPPNVIAPEKAESLIRGYWMNTLKHAKVLHRGFDIVAAMGLSMEKSVLLQLWYIAETGRDPSHTFGVTIHGLLDQARAALTYKGQAAKDLFLNGDLTHTEQVIEMIERVRDEVSGVGREIAIRLDFEYPELIEQTAREHWETFKQGRKASTDRQ
jgi:predicted nucleotidyltransferase